MNQTDIFVPDLGLLPGQVKLICWTTPVGNLVFKGDTIVTFEANQRAVSIKAPATGLLTCQSLKLGDTLTLSYDTSLGTILNLTIPAECHDDRYQLKADFDAVEWFEQATDQAIQDLADCDWRGDEPADLVAEFFQESNTRVAAVFAGVDDFNKNRFECSVDEDCAMDWLRQHRVELFKLLSGKSNEESTSDSPIAPQEQQQSHVVPASPALRAMGVESVDFSDLVTQLDNLGLNADKPAAAADEFNLDESIRSLFRLSAIASNLQESINRQKADLLTRLQQHPELLPKGKTYEIEQGSITLLARKQYRIERNTVHDLLLDGMLNSNTLIGLAFPNESVQNAEALKTLLGRDLFDESTREREASEFLVVKPSKVTKNSVAQEIQFWDVMKPGADLDVPWRSIGSEESLLEFNPFRKQHSPGTNPWD